MPRDPSGNYTLPALGNPAVTNTPITIAWWNGTSTDMAAALTDSLSRSGLGGMLGAFGVVDGSSSAPGLTFTSETGSGLYRPSAGEIDFVIGGTRLSRWTAAGFQESFDNGATWKNPLYNNNGNQTFTGGLDFTAGNLTVGGSAVHIPTRTASGSSGGAFQTSSASYVQITNFSVTFTATGGPVQVIFQPDGSANRSQLSVYNTTTAQTLLGLAVSVDNGVTFIGEQNFGLDLTPTGINGSWLPMSAYQFWFAPGAGSVTLKGYAKVIASGGSPQGTVKYGVLHVTQF